MEGLITFYNKVLRWGYFDCPDLNLKSEYFKINENANVYKEINRGDKIYFEYEFNNIKQYLFNSLKFIQNTNLEALRLSYKNKKILSGYIKPLSNEIYIKDKETYILIKLIVSKYDYDFKRYLKEYNNVLIKYQIIKFSDNNKIRAINAETSFVDFYNSVVNEEPIKGKIISKINGGYRVRLVNGVIGFLPNSLAKKSEKNLDIETEDTFVCLQVSKTLNNYVLDLSRD